VIGDDISGGVKSGLAHVEAWAPARKRLRETRRSTVSLKLLFLSHDDHVSSRQVIPKRRPLPAAPAKPTALLNAASSRTGMNASVSVVSVNLGVFLNDQGYCSCESHWLYYIDQLFVLFHC